MRTTVKSKGRFGLAILVVVFVFLMQIPGVYADGTAVPVTDGTTPTPSPIPAATGTATGNGDYFQSLIDMIKDKYKGDITDKKLMEAAIKAMFGSMDPYTVFYTPAEAESFFGNINGSFTGIGVTLEKNGDYVMITKVFSDSPAEKRGLLQGDRIAEVNGKSMKGKGPDDVASVVLGEAGTAVKLGILRNGDAKLRYFTLTRAVITINPVSYEIRGNVGYIKLDMFNSNTDQGMTKALREMDSRKITKIILDLRGNPGGEVSQAVAVARKFVPKGTITTLDFNSASLQDTVYTSDLEKIKYKLAVLVDGNSASASEIVSGAIQDTKAGTLIGTKTFGKAKVQSILPILTQEAFEKYSKQLGVKISDVYELETRYGVAPTDDEILGYTKITTGLYYTPKGRMIDGKGIQPDIYVAGPKAAAGIDIASAEKVSFKTKLIVGSEGSDVRDAEILLKLLGYDAGTVDAKYDAKTAAAVRKFQQAKKLKKDGIIGRLTANTLNGEFEKALLKLDPQYAKALEALNK